MARLPGMGDPSRGTTETDGQGREKEEHRAEAEKTDPGSGHEPDHGPEPAARDGLCRGGAAADQRPGGERGPAGGPLRAGGPRGRPGILRPAAGVRPAGRKRSVHHRPDHRPGRGGVHPKGDGGPALRPGHRPVPGGGGGRGVHHPKGPGHRHRHRAGDPTSPGDLFLRGHLRGGGPGQRQQPAGPAPDPGADPVRRSPGGGGAGGAERHQYCKRGWIYLSLHLHQQLFPARRWRHLLCKIQAGHPGCHPETGRQRPNRRLAPSGKYSR